MNRVMFTVEEVKAKISSGENLLLAGDEKVLRQLPTGNWIGGTIPYFMAENGGEFTQEKVFATQLPPYISSVSVHEYDETNLANVYTDIPENAVGFIIMPASSQANLSFAVNAPGYPAFATRPLIGWVAGTDLADLGKVTAKVFNGNSGLALENKAIVMHVTLPAGKVAEVDILNIFEQGDGDVLTFAEDGFIAREVCVNGEIQNFADYLTKIQADTKLPLVANYYGALINISIQTIDAEKKEVHFYAPVFKHIPYKLARPVENYVTQFTARFPQGIASQVTFSCNCILNYLYSELEGKQTGGMLGPITFGEVAYQLLNQTMVYLVISDIEPAV